jgi:hypothetical protein
MTKTSFAIEKPRELGLDGDIVVRTKNLAGFDLIEELVHFDHLIKIRSHLHCYYS